MKIHNAVRRPPRLDEHREQGDQHDDAVHAVARASVSAGTHGLSAGGLLATSGGRQGDDGRWAGGCRLVGAVARRRQGQGDARGGDQVRRCRAGAGVGDSLRCGSQAHRDGCRQTGARTGHGRGAAFGAGAEGGDGHAALYAQGVRRRA